MLKKTKGKPKLVVILGPTASGKTGLALRLAKQFRGEIVSADSRQTYKGMEIGTAQPKQAKSAKRKAQNDSSKLKVINNIPHYLIGIIRPNQKFNVALYKKLAFKAIKGIQKRNKLPFLVGGTGLYIQAIVDNFDYPKIKPNPRLRKQLEKQSAKALFSLYKKLDARGAKLIDKNNKRRLVRAIEVCKISGKPFWLQRQKQTPLFETLQLGLKIPQKQLAKNISLRTNKMMESGLEKEARRLLAKYGKNLPSLQTIGYQEWLPYLGARIGAKTRQVVALHIKKHTFQYAKRQMTWFKRDKRIIWINNSYRAKNLIKKFLG